MNKTELILSIAEETGFSRKDVEIGLNAAIHQITKALVEGEKIQIVGFGAFETKVRAERMGRNPKTGENIPIPATKIPAFKAGKALKDAVDQFYSSLYMRAAFSLPFISVTERTSRVPVRAPKRISSWSPTFTS